MFEFGLIERWVSTKYHHPRKKEKKSALQKGNVPKFPSIHKAVLVFGAQKSAALSNME